MFLVGIGLVLGIAGAVGTTRLLAGMLFQVNATDPLTFAGVTGFLALVATGASLLPAWRAVRTDSMRVFRTQ
jgi:putative ABC transport system permease protein